MLWLPLVKGTTYFDERKLVGGGEKKSLFPTENKKLLLKLWKLSEDITQCSTILHKSIPECFTIQQKYTYMSIIYQSEVCFLMPHSGRVFFSLEEMMCQLE